MPSALNFCSRPLPGTNVAQLSAKAPARAVPAPIKVHFKIKLSNSLQKMRPDSVKCGKSLGIS
jgi:hypothetical protein